MADSIPTPAENGEYMRQIAERSPEALSMVVQYLDASARQQEAIEDRLRSELEQERDEWRERALEAEARLHRAQQRLINLFY